MQVVMQEGTLELTLTERFTFKTRRGLRLFTKDSGRDFPLEGAAVDATDVGLTGYSDLVACASEVGADDRALIGRLPEPFETSLAHVAAALDLQRGSGKKALLAGSRSNVFFVGGYTVHVGYVRHRREWCVRPLERDTVLWYPGRTRVFYPAPR